MCNANKKTADDITDDINFDYDSLKWVQTIQKKHRKYSIKSDARELAYFLYLCIKYAPKDEYSDINIVYGDVVEDQFSYKESEKEEIINKALEILESKYNINFRETLK